jgi:hypothetical protein
MFIVLLIGGFDKDIFYNNSMNTEFAYGSCLTNCIYFYEALGEFEPKYFVGYYYAKNKIPEFHVFIAFRTKCRGYYIYDPSREFDLFLPENIQFSADKNIFLLKNDVITITSGSSYGTYFAIHVEDDAKKCLFKNFLNDWKNGRDQKEWEFSFDELIKTDNKKMKIQFKDFKDLWDKKKQESDFDFLKNYSYSNSPGQNVKIKRN